MKASDGCKLFGAHQALSGIRGGVVLLHSVVGCNFGSMSFHAACDMTDLHQTCTVISDSDVVFGGEASLARALRHVEELYHPEVIFVVTGCVSDIVQDDISAVTASFDGQARVISVEAAGYRGGLRDGSEAGLNALANLMALSPASGSMPAVNLLGLGADDPRARQDLAAFRTLLGDQVHFSSAFSQCDVDEVRYASGADLNLVLGRGVSLGQTMEARFGVPMEILDYPYGLIGADALWTILESRFGLDFSIQRKAFRQQTAEGLRPIYSYLQALYGIPAAVIGTGARSRGMARFLTCELGMEVVCRAERETLPDLETFYDQVRASEAAILFGSSFELELAQEMDIPLFRYDYPVFDRLCVTQRPYLGAEGTLCLVEDLINEIMGARTLKGALYQ